MGRAGDVNGRVAGYGVHLSTLHCNRLVVQLGARARWLQKLADDLRGYDGDGLDHDELVDLRREAGYVEASARRLRRLAKSIGSDGKQRALGPRKVKRLEPGSIF